MFKRQIIFILVLLASLFSQFQNCAPQGSFESASMSPASLVATEGDADPTEPETPVVIKDPISNFSTPFTDRDVTAGILEHAFGPSTKAADSANIELLGSYFGKSCSLMSEYYVMAGGSRTRGANEICRLASANFGVTTASNSTVTRSSNLIKACSDLSSNTITLNYFMTQLGSPSDLNAFTDASLTKAYQLFFVGKPEPSQTVLSALKIIATSQPDGNKAWSAIAYTLCSSGQWQVL